MNVTAHNMDKKKIDSLKIPNHVAIIMDGNGRWAKKINKERFFGHNSGIKSVRESIDISLELGIKQLTLYAFSSENWSRPKREVSSLMNLLSSSVEKEIPRLIENNIKLEIIGDTSKLPEITRNKLLAGVQETSQNDVLILSLAISYGARQELIRATKLISEKVKKNIISVENIDENIINEHLYTRNLKNVDLLIRTGGELRLSNFLLWQISYAELCFQDVLWPDFKKEHFLNAIINYQGRTRRFGKINK